MEFLAAPSTEGQAKVLAITAASSLWMKPIIDYLQEGQLPDNKVEARRMRARAARYYLHDDMLYKRGFMTPLLRCLDDLDCQTVLKEIHASHCGNHAEGILSSKGTPPRFLLAYDEARHNESSKEVRHMPEVCKNTTSTTRLPSTDV